MGRIFGCNNRYVWHISTETYPLTMNTVCGLKDEPTLWFRTESNEIYEHEWIVGRKLCEKCFPTNKET